MYAPTGMGRQSPVMVVVQDKETVAQLSKNECYYYGELTVIRSTELPQ